MGARLAGASRVRTLLERALELDLGAARAHLGLAILALALEEEPSEIPRDPLDPVLHLSVARDLRPGLPEPHLLLARLHLARGEVRAARRDLEALLEEPPETRYGAWFPDAQIAEWRAASGQARALLTLIP